LRASPRAVGIDRGGRRRVATGGTAATVRLQIEVAQDDPAAIAFLAADTHHFSYGESFGSPDCACRSSASTTTRPACP
jgi:hypothetical protein